MLSSVSYFLPLCVCYMWCCALRSDVLETRLEYLNLNVFKRHCLIEENYLYLSARLAAPPSLLLFLFLLISHT